MVVKGTFTIIWDKVAFDNFKEILNGLSIQSDFAPRIVRDGVLSRLNVVKKNGFIHSEIKMSLQAELFQRKSSFVFVASDSLLP